MNTKTVIPRIMSVVLLLGVASLAACSQPAPEPTPIDITRVPSIINTITPLPRATVSLSDRTPGIGGVTGITETVTAVSTLPSTTRTPTVASNTSTPVVTARPSIVAPTTPSAAATVTPSAAVSPTPTPTYAASFETQSAARALEGKLSAFLLALNVGNVQGQLSAQKELLDAIKKAEAAVADDKSKDAERIREAIGLAKQGAEGDRTKIQDADDRLRAILALGAADRGTPQLSSGGGSLGDATANLAAKAEAFRRALQSGQGTDALRAQRELSDAVDLLEQKVKNISSPEADRLRSAIEDIRNSLGGDRGKLDSALEKLGRSATPVASPSAVRTGLPIPTSASSTDLQPYVRSLSDKLSRLSNAQRDGRAEEANNLRREIEAEIARAKDAISNDRSAKADQLRSAIQALQEAFNGDQAKFDTALNKLRDLQF